MLALPLVRSNPRRRRAGEDDEAEPRRLLARAARLRRQGRLDDALAVLRRVVDLSPGLDAAHRMMAAIHVARREPQRAVDTYRHALEAAPDALWASADLAALLRALGRGDQALAVAQATVAVLPASSEAHGLLAVELHHQGRLDESVAEHRRAVALAPDSAVAHTNLGVTLHARGDLEGAAACHATAVALDPRNARAHHNLALAHMATNRLDEAVDALRTALAIDPRNAELHWDHALALLGSGRLREGWEAFEWRWHTAALAPARRHVDVPRWDGSPLAGRRLLLWAEQGLGDTIQFVRYAALLTRHGERIVLECAPGLRRLLQAMPSFEAVVSPGESPGTVDVQLPLLSVPRLFGTTMRSVPATVPYLLPAAADRQRWAHALGGGAGLRVGVVWAGSPTHRNDRNRSIAPALLAPLLAVPGIDFFGLQVTADPGASPRGLRNLGPSLVDFAETAAVIANLDLTITVDTAVAHLAGALGAPVWVLLPFAADWRWMRDRQDSPWYPSMRLFRQAAPGQWQPVIGRVADDLDRLARDRRQG